MKAIVDCTGLMIDFSQRDAELWLDDEKKPVLTGSDAQVAILAIRLALGRCCPSRIENRGYALRYVGSDQLVDPVRIANFLATSDLTLENLYTHLIAA